MKGLLAAALLFSAALGLRSPPRKKLTLPPENGTELALLGPGPKARSKRIDIGVGGSVEEQAAEEVYRRRQEEFRHAKRLKVKCMESFPASQRWIAACPQECPYMRFDPTRMCHWRCVTEQRCLHTPGMPPSIADDELGMCVVCQVPGCKQCMGHTRSCAVCNDGFDFEEGRCLPRSRHAWHCVYAVLLTFLTFLIWYIVCLSWRTTRNTAVLQEALAYRSKCKTRRMGLRHDFYSFATNLAGELTDSGGVGVLLHFRFQAALVIWCVLAAICLGLPAAWHRRLRATDALEMAPAHEEVLHACAKIGENEEAAMEEMRIDFLYAMGVLYFLTFLGSLYFAVSQRRRYHVEEAEAVTMMDFALCCENFPKMAWDSAAEEEVLTFFRDAWGEENVVGVSLVWDTADCLPDVNRALDASLYQLDCERPPVSPTSPTSPSAGGFEGVKEEEEPQEEEQEKAGEPTPVPAPAPVEPGPAPAAAAASSSSPMASEEPAVDDRPKAVVSFRDEPTIHEVELPLSSERQKPRKSTAKSTTGGNWLTLEPLDSYTWQSICEDETLGEPECSALSEITTTGTVFVVLRSEYHRAMVEREKLPRFRGEHEISVAHLSCEPETVLWDGFTMTNKERAWRVFVGCCSICLTILGWCLCFYGPFAWYILSWSGVAGMSQGGFTEGFLLGLVVTLGNIVVRMQCLAVAEKARCRDRDNRDMLNVILYTFSVLINTIIDLWLVTVMAHGWQQDSGVDTQAMVRNPGAQHALFVQLVAYIYPSTIIIPFVLEPIISVIAPFYLCKWLVRSYPRMNRWKAEQSLACPTFDLMRYGDLIINVVLILMLFFLTSVNMWWSCLILLNSSLVIYLWDHTRFLRMSTRTYFATHGMEICGQYMWILPCCVLASVFAFKLQGGQAMVRSWGKQGFLSYHREWLVCLLAFFLHGILHFLALYFVVPLFVQPERDVLSVRYEEAARKISCNWFNANPVNCLRSMHYFKHAPPHVFFIPGKEYLQRQNAEIHAYYEASEYGEEGSALKDVADYIRSSCRAMAPQLSFAKSDNAGEGGQPRRCCG